MDIIELRMGGNTKKIKRDASLDFMKILQTIMLNFTDNNDIKSQNGL